MKQRPALMVSPAMRAAFSDDELQFFDQVLVAEPTFSEAPLPDIASDLTVFAETAGTTENPRCVALPLTVLNARRAAEPDTPGPVLRAMPLHGAEAIATLTGLNGEMIWLNPTTIAEQPEALFAAIADHGVATLKLTAGQARRIVSAMEGAQTPRTLQSLQLIELSGGPVSQELCTELLALFANPAGVHLRVVYRTVEAGPICWARIDPSAWDGRHLTYATSCGGAKTRIVDPEFTILAPGEVGEIQVSQTPSLAPAYRNPNGRHTPLVDGSGWFKTGDRGVLSAGGLIVTSATGDTLTVPRRAHLLADIEAALTGIGGVRPETVAVSLPVDADHRETGALEVFFDATSGDPGEVARVASELFTQVIALTGVQPNVYRVRRDQTPVTPGLAPRRAHLARLVANGVLRATVAPKMQNTSPEAIAQHELTTMIAAIWQEVLELDTPPGADANFFDLGADSLNLTTMLDRVEAQSGLAVDIEAFFETPTIAYLSRLLGEASAKAASETEAPVAGESDVIPRLARFVEVWRGARPFPDSLIRSANLGGSKPPLFWVLQSEQSFRDLAETLGPDQPFHALRSAVGVVDHYTTGPLEAIADRYLWEIMAQTKGAPFYLGGNCQGAIVALVLARRLKLIGQAPERLVMMEWFFDFGGYDGPTTFLTGTDSFVAELQQTVPSLQRLSELFPGSTAHEIPGSHGQFFRQHIIGGVADGIRRALAD